MTQQQHVPPTYCNCHGWKWSLGKKNVLCRGYLDHRKGVETARKVIRRCNDVGVECLTLFAFSSENWKRPAEEVDGLMALFVTAFRT